MDIIIPQEKIRPQIPAEIPDNLEDVKALLGWTEQYEAYLTGHTHQCRIIDIRTGASVTLGLPTEPHPDTESIEGLRSYREELWGKLGDIIKNAPPSANDDRDSGVRPVFDNPYGERDDDEFEILEGNDLEETA